MAGNSSTQPSANGGLTPEQQLANRLARVSSDMDEVTNYLDALDALLTLDSGHPKHLSAILHALLSAAIVSYSRSFLKSDSAGNALRRLDFQMLPVAAAEWATQLHETIIDRRNQAVAHADWEHHNTALIASQAPLGGTFRVRSVANIYRGIDLKLFRELAKRVRTGAEAMRFDIDRCAR